jgi:hypothetical protein
VWPGDLPVIVASRLRAPREDSAVLAIPPLQEAGELLDGNHQRFRQSSLDLCGRSLAQLRQVAGQSAKEAAAEYLRRAGEPLPSSQSASALIMAGHQPELFHAGVWVKNFALNGIARAHSGTALNLIVDNDTVKTPALSMPLTPSAEGADKRTHRLDLPFDRWAPEIPYEERTVLDEELFKNFPVRAQPILDQWGFRSFLPEFWSEALRQAERTALLGERFAAARRVFERSWGCHNLEVPLSYLCRSETFLWFAAHLLADLQRFHEIHNSALAEYRRANGVRSRSHPVPDLASENDWLEAPFWVWPTQQPQRTHLMARHIGENIELRIGDKSVLNVRQRPNNDCEALAAGLRGLEKLGFRMRSRALTTTLYARLFLADLFVHGIGGAKYDELSDEVMRRFYGLEPPRYLVLSATLLLPFRPLPAQPEECRSLARQLRDLHYNPQRHLKNGALVEPQARVLADEKQKWIDLQPSDKAGRRERFYRLQSLTGQLEQFVSVRERSLGRQLEQCLEQSQINADLFRRDYAFCLFPEAKLRPFCTQFLQAKRA